MIFFTILIIASSIKFNFGSCVLIKPICFVNAGNMTGGSSLRKAITKKVGNVKKLLGGSSSSRRPSPSHSPPRARSARRGSTRRESPPPAEESDEEDVEYEQELEPDSEDESLDEEDSEEEGGEEDSEEEGGEEGPPLGTFELDPSLQWEPPEEEWVETDPTIPPPQSKPPYQRGAATLPDLPYGSRHTLLVPTGARYI